jgi:hypothetical protein
MRVTANAGPLIALGRIGQVALLPALYQVILVPPAVRHEVTHDPVRPGAADLQHATWLHTVPITDQHAVQHLRVWLDLGESEAIVLARTTRTALVMDERRGRMVAAAQGITCIGTGRVLVDAKQQGHILAVTPLLDALQAAGVHLSRRLYAAIQQAAGE